MPHINQNISFQNISEQSQGGKVRALFEVNLMKEYSPSEAMAKNKRTDSILGVM